MIRIKTLRELARRERSIVRVRWRVWHKGEDGSTVCDDEGVERDAGTWAKWEEEYFITVRQAHAAATADASPQVRPRGQIDQVPARQLWAALSRERDQDELTDYDEGYLRSLLSQESGPGRLPRDEKRPR